MSEESPDVFARYNGTVGIMLPLTPQVDQWLAEHRPEDSPRFGGGWAVEDAEFLPTVQEMREAGFVVEMLNAGDTY